MGGGRRKKKFRPPGSVAFVRAPACPRCGEPMGRHDDLSWICRNEACDQGAVAGSTVGCYPLISVTPRAGRAKRGGAVFPAGEGE